MHYREKLFKANEKEARETFIRYIDSIMNSSYLDGEELTVDEKSCRVCRQQNMPTAETESTSDDSQTAMSLDVDGRDDNDTTSSTTSSDTMQHEEAETERESAPTDYALCEDNNNVVPIDASGIFADVISGGVLEQEQLQRIRDTRNKDKKDEIQGKIIHCKDCDTLYSTNDLVQMSLNYYKRIADHRSQQQSGTFSHHEVLDLSDDRRDIACYRIPYDADSLNSSGVSLTFFDTLEARLIMLRSNFDEHDYRHRPGCFKKGKECRFNLAKQACAQTTLHIEDALEDGSNVEDWHRLDQSEPLQTTPYLVETKRTMGSQFINTHSMPVSFVMTCNTNMQVGVVAHLFYATAYAFKDTQKEDSERFIRIGTQVIKRLLRMKHIAMENAARENRVLEEEQEPDFGEGLSMLLSGMNANMAKAICSSTMAHLLILNKDGQRFEYSHEFSHILVGQMEDILHGKEGCFRIRSNFSKTTKKTVTWADSSADDYIYRNELLENMSLYEFNAKCTKICKTFKEMNNESNNITGASMIDDDAMEVDVESDDEIEEDDEESCSSKKKSHKYKFLPEHPGREFSYVKRNKLECIPVISLPKDGLCCIKDMEIGVDDPNPSVVEKRERYAMLAMLMFYPFRTLDDLKGEDGTYWSTFQSILGHINEEDDTDDMYHTFYEFGMDILHNMDERESIKSMKSAIEPLVKRTVFIQSEADNGNRNDNDDDDGNAIDLVAFDEDAERDINDFYGGIGAFGQLTQRSQDAVIENGGVDMRYMIGARVSNAHGNSLISANNDEAVMQDQGNATTEDTTRSSNQSQVQASYPQLITFVEGMIIGGNYDEYKDACQEDDDDEMGDGSDTRPITGIPTLKSVAAKVAKQENKILDEKQYIAYEIIAASFILDTLEKEASSSSLLGQLDAERKARLIRKLRALGGHSQLIMFLTGFAGAGKSTCVTIAERFCFEFCRAVSIPWNDDTFLFTATTGAAASLFGGTTIHDAAFLNGNDDNISNAKREQWRRVSMLIIDEISFFTQNNITKLDNKLKNIKGVHNKPYGGVSIVFSGDFHQLKPIMDKKNDHVLFDGRTNGFFLGNINSVMILEVSHRFDEDPEYGEVLHRMWSGNFTVDDVRYINTRVVGQNGVTLPPDCTDSDTTYATALNKQRNGISSGVFRNHLKSTDFPPVNSDALPPEHTIIIEADIQSSSTAGRQGVTRVSPSITDAIINTCGDADCRCGRSKMIDPCLKLYIGAHVMVNNNDLLKSHGIGNGSMARVKRVQLKSTATNPEWKNWEGKKVYCVSVNDVEYIEIERCRRDSYNQRT